MPDGGARLPEAATRERLAEFELPAVGSAIDDQSGPIVLVSGAHRVTRRGTPRARWQRGRVLQNRGVQLPVRVRIPGQSRVRRSRGRKPNSTDVRTRDTKGRRQ